MAATEEASDQDRQPNPAPLRRIGRQAFQSIEYPGPIRQAPASLEKALGTLGTEEDRNRLFNRAAPNLELNFQPNNFWSHPIAGERVGVQRLVLKVTRKRRKLLATNHVGDDVDMNGTARRARHVEPGGVYKIEMAGVVKSTVRFRGMLPLNVRN